jgi:hypothetical protein
MKRSVVLSALMLFSFTVFSQETIVDTLQTEKTVSASDTTVKKKWSQMTLLERGKWGYGKGYVIDLSGNKTLCLTSGDEVAVLTLVNSGEKRVYRPNEALEFLSDTVRYISDGKYFIKVIAEANGTVICKRILRSERSMKKPAQEIVYYYIRRPGERELTNIPYLIWGKALNKYFADCPAMQAALKGANLKRRDEEMMSIPVLYAQACSVKK